MILSKPRSSKAYLRFSVAVCAVLIAWFAAPMFAGIGAQPASAGVLYSVPATSATIPAGGTAQFQVRGMALQPGSAISTGALALATQPFPSDKVRIALYYGINWGYTESDPQQAVLAVWYAQDNTWRGDSHKDADNIISAAANAPAMPSWNPNGRSAVQLSATGQVTLSQITFTPSAQSPAMGSGVLTVTNISGGDLNVHLPYGALFGSESNAVLVWAVAATVSSVQAAPATATSDVPSSTTATLPAQQPTAQEPKKSAPSATATPIAEASAAPPQKATPNGAPKYVNTPTATVTPTNTPTDTSVPTNTATNTIVPTATSTNTSLPTSTATATQAPPTATAERATLPADAAHANSAQKQAPANAAIPGTSSSTASAKTNPSGSADSAQAPQKTAAGTQDTENSAGDDVKASSQAKNTVETGETVQAALAPLNKSQAETRGDKSIQAAAPVVPLTSVPSVGPVGSVGAGQGEVAGRNAAPPPPPVGTAVGTAGASPSTSPTGNPPAVQTVHSTVPPRATTTTGSPSAATTGVSTGTVTPSLKFTASPTGGNSQPPAPVPSVQSTQGALPTAIPTTSVLPTVQAQPTSLTDVGPPPIPTQPVIDTTPDKAPTQPAPGNVSDGQQSPTQSSVGNTSPTPDASPKTGAGPSTLPIWLSLASALLVLGGWKLRRLGAVQTATAKVSVES